MDLEPLNDRILLEKVPEPDGVIVLTDKPETRRFRVIAVGPGVWRDGYFVKTALKPGDVVILPGIAVTHPDWQEQQYILAQESDVGCLVEHG